MKLGLLSPSSLLQNLRSFRSSNQGSNANVHDIQEHHLLDINANVDDIQEHHLLDINANVDDIQGHHILDLNNDVEQGLQQISIDQQEVDITQQGEHQAQLRNDAVTVSLFILTASIFLLVNSPGAGAGVVDSERVNWYLILYTTSLYLTFFLGIGLLLYTITHRAVAGDQIIRVQSKLMILGIVSLVVPLLIRTSLAGYAPVLGLLVVWIPPIITIGLSLRFLCEANRALASPIS